jgi:pyruvate carboxylase
LGDALKKLGISYELDVSLHPEKKGEGYQVPGMGFARRERNKVIINEKKQSGIYFIGPDREHIGELEEKVETDLKFEFQ